MYKCLTRQSDISFIIPFLLLRLSSHCFTALIMLLLQLASLIAPVAAYEQYFSV
jgi:hypothetical protein